MEQTTCPHPFLFISYHALNIKLLQIESIEEDALTTKAALAPAPPHGALSRRTMVTQHQAPWGLGRISHRARNSPDYFYSSSAGEGVRVYVLDTGIRTSHAEFGPAPGRAVWGANFVPGSPDADEDGHGTHVAGTVAGRTFGVAKRATVVAVKVLDRSGSGYMSYLLRGLDWAVADARKRGVAGRAVVNLSLGGEYTAAVNAGVRAATDAGLTVVVAAGNDNATASGYSPGSEATAITVGASDRADMRAYFSNFGGAVDIFAPGVGILSASKGGDARNMTMSGTSMAAPHVAGLAAYFIARGHLSGYAAVSKRILEAATKGVGNRKGSADRIAYNAHGV
ncbi:hypothetical protein VTK26DRAFT_9452 [Humicola hyalothermophila]